MDNGRELIAALEIVSKERGIDKEIIFEAIESSLVSACKKHFGATLNPRVTVDRQTGEYLVYAAKTVVEEVQDNLCEISLTEARSINQEYQLEDIIELKIKPGAFGRISAQTAKQVVVQKFREAERENIFAEFTGKQGQVVNGTVGRRDRRSVVVNLGTTDAYLATADQIPRENYQFNDRIRVYIQEVKQTSKGPVINVSRTHSELVKYLFEQEVPEISDGVVEIKAVSREPGNRAKIAVHTNNPNVDPIGACVGPNGSRVNHITYELSGERIDIIQWSADPAQFIAAALSPSKVSQVVVSNTSQVSRVVVPDNQLSLAIGKEGQNARLASRLTGWRIDIRSESQAEGTDFLMLPEEDEAPTPIVAAEVYETAEETAAPEVTTDEPTTEPAAATTDAETVYYDDEYYDDEYYDDEYYDDEYYDDEYYDEYYDEAAQGETSPKTEEQ